MVFRELIAGQGETRRARTQGIRAGDVCVIVTFWFAIVSTPERCEVLLFALTAYGGDG